MFEQSGRAQPRSALPTESAKPKHSTLDYQTRGLFLCYTPEPAFKALAYLRAPRRPRDGKLRRKRVAKCFVDRRDPSLIEHSVATLVGQRIFGLALGYEDLNDHDALRHDPLFAVLAGKLKARRADCAPVAGKSTLNRLERSKETPSLYHKIAYDGAAIEKLLVDLFLESHASAPEEIILDLDATDDPLLGGQEGRFFHGYYDCYCHLPLYVFCGDQLLVAKLRKADIDASAGAADEIARVIARIRARWPKVRIILRADSGFAREELMPGAKPTTSSFCSVWRRTLG